MRYQAGQQPRPAATTINTRVWVAERALRCQFPDVVPPVRRVFSSSTGGNRHSAMAVRVRR